MSNDKARRICVIGLGVFGSETAHQLARHSEVLALDSHQSRVDAISEDVQRAIKLDVRDEEALRSVVSEDFDVAVVALTDNLEASILCTLHLQKIGLPSIRAAAVSDDHAAVLRAVGATEIVFPERDSARRLAARILKPNLLDYIPLSGDYAVMDVDAPAAFQGKSLADLRLRQERGCFVLGIRDEDGIDILPGPDYRVQEKDTLVMLGPERELLELQQGDD